MADPLSNELRPLLEILYRQSGSPADPITCMVIGAKFGAALMISKENDFASSDQVKPVRLADGTLENFTVRLGGQLHRCECGCNVFHKPDDTNLGLYRCNACDMEFEAE